MSESDDFGFDGFDGRKLGSDDPCPKCREPFHEHDKERRYPDGGPPGTYCYHYVCP